MIIISACHVCEQIRKVATPIYAASHAEQLNSTTLKDHELLSQFGAGIAACEHAT